MLKITLFIVTLFSILSVFNSARCGESEVFTCNDNQTCCKGPTGWNCHNIGQCCLDLITVCDYPKKCDIVNHRCDDAVTQFLKLN